MQRKGVFRLPTAPIAAIQEEQAAAGPSEGVYSTVLAQSMKRQESRDQADSLAEMLRDAREKADARREKLERAKPTPRYGDAPMEAYARISRAHTPAQAGSAAGFARRRLAQLESAIRSDPEHADQIRAAISQTKKAVGRANRKKLELTREQLARARMKRMAREERRREEQRLRQELRRSQAMRAIRESGYFTETDIANRQADQLAATRAELNAQAEQLGVTGRTAVDAAVQGYSTAVETARIADAPVSAPQVDVQA